MVFYSRASRSKIVHLSNCRFVKKIRKSNRAYFETLEDAREAGFRLCNCCAPIAKHFRKESKSIEEFCRKEGLSVYLHDGVLIIRAPHHSKWKLITAGKNNKLFLYHKNTLPEREGMPDSEIPGYHSQAVHKKTIIAYLQYIISHDAWRRNHPVALPVAKRPAPQKGTKRWFAEQKKGKRRQLKMQIQNVLTLIDSVQAGDRVAG